MPSSTAKLSEKLFSPDIEKKATRDGFGAGVVEAGRADERVVVLCADLKESTRAEVFEKAFPERFVEMGVAEQNMAAVAAGMALVGKVPFIASYAAFNPGRNYEQIRTTIALNEANVKVCGMHAGVSVGPDGATHQMLEDIGMMRMLPNMIVLNPGDAEEAKKAVIAAAKRTGNVVTIEEHQAAGGFGSAVAELLSEKYPVRIKRMGIQDEFGQSGEPDELLTHYQLDAPSIAEEVRALLHICIKE